MKGNSNPTVFLPLKSEIGRPVSYIKDMGNICLTVNQAKYIYKKVEQDSIVNVNMTKQEIEDD